MLKLLHQNDPALLNVPPKVVPTINKLIDVSGSESPPVQGFVVFVEKRYDNMSPLSFFSNKKDIVVLYINTY